MPTYDYKCDACDHLWEEFQSIKADPIKKCPSCGKSKARRQIGGGAGLIFKGSGFYITDYRSEGYKSAAKSDVAAPAAAPAKESSSAPSASTPSAAATPSSPKSESSKPSSSESPKPKKSPGKK